MPLQASYGGQNPATNNQMELKAAIEGLKALESLRLSGDAIELVSDSRYVLGSANGSYNGDKNLELIQELRELVARVGVKVFRWVPGHQGDLLNERCDSLAKTGKKDAATRPN